MTKEAFGKIRDGLEEAIAAIRDEEFFDQLFQRVIESGTHMRAADLRPALCTEASPTRTGNTTEIGHD